jgi:hypothetical protein
VNIDLTDSVLVLGLHKLKTKIEILNEVEFNHLLEKDRTIYLSRIGPLNLVGLDHLL